MSIHLAEKSTKDMSRLNKFRPVDVLFAATSLLLLAACAGDSADTSGTEDGADTSGTEDIELISQGTLSVCATFVNPPNHFRDDEGEGQGVEVEIAEDVAENMGLEIEFQEYSFAGLIPALQGGQCDAIFSTMYIQPDREEIVDFVPYLMAGSAVAVPGDNPEEVTGYDETLCGVRAIAVTGSTGADLLEEQTQECQELNEPAINITLVDRATDALQQTATGQQDAFVNTVEQILYFEAQSDGAFQRVGETFGEIAMGAATLKGTNGLHEAIESAFDETVESGSYDAILEEWGLEQQNIVDAE